MRVSVVVRNSTFSTSLFEALAEYSLYRPRAGDTLRGVFHLVARVSAPAILILALVALANTASAAPGSSTAKIVPAGTKLVVAIDIDSLRKGAHWKALTALALKADYFEGAKDGKVEFKKIFGRTQSIVAALPDPSDTKRFVLILQGTGLYPLVKKAVLDDDAVWGKHRGVRFLIHEEAALAQIAGSVVMAPVSVMKKVIDVSAGRSASLGDSKAFQALLAEIDTKAEAWLLMDGGASGLGLPKLDQLEAFAFSVSLKLGLAMQATARMPSDEAASKMLNEVESARAKLAKDVGLQTLGLEAAVKNTKLTHQGTRLNVSLVLDRKEFAALAPIWNLIVGQL